jgi:hypothetical protein
MSPKEILQFHKAASGFRRHKALCHPHSFFSEHEASAQMQKQRAAFILAANIHYIRFTSPDGLGPTSAKITFQLNPNKPDNTDNITINNNSTRLNCSFIIIIIIIILYLPVSCNLDFSCNFYY